MAFITTRNAKSQGCALRGPVRCEVAPAFGYRERKPANDNELEAMRRIDALFSERPFFGTRRMAKTLCEDGFPIDRKRVRRLMRLMGIEALGPKPRTSQPAPGHQIYPYLLRGLSTATIRTRSRRPTSPTSRSAKAFCIMVAVIDWASRAVFVLAGFGTRSRLRSASRR